jgi:hypothetical protein
MKLQINPTVNVKGRRNSLVEEITSTLLCFLRAGMQGIVELEALHFLERALNGRSGRLRI